MFWWPSPEEQGGLNGVVATLAPSLLLGVYEADIVRGRQFKQIKALFRFWLSTSVRIDSQREASSDQLVIGCCIDRLSRLR